MNNFMVFPQISFSSVSLLVSHHTEDFCLTLHIEQALPNQVFTLLPSTTLCFALILLSFLLFGHAQLIFDGQELSSGLG